MADLAAKRKRLAENTVIQAGRLVEAVNALEALAVERSQVGNFDDLEFADTTEGFDLRHLSAFLVGLFLETIVPRLTTALDTSGTGGVPRDILHQVKR